MNSPSRLIHRRARAIIAGALIATGLIVAAGWMVPVRSQEPPRQEKPANRPEAPKFERAPDALLRVQRLKTRKARILHERARLDRELAELAIEEYREDTYPHDLAMAEFEIIVAERDRDRAKDHLDRARRRFKQGQLSETELLIVETYLEKCDFLIEALQSKKDVLVKYVREHTIKELEGEVKKARKVEGDKEAAWKRQAARQAELEWQADRK